MAAKERRPPLFLLGSLLLLVGLTSAGVAFVAHRLRREESRADAPVWPAEPPPAPREPAAVGRKVSARVLPRAARSSGPAVSSQRAAREEAARQERALMARTWGMTEEQHRRFDEAATKPHLARRALYEKLSDGAIPPDAFQRALDEADAADEHDLREVLGSHYQEYALMRGHFAEAGLDQHPFEPPKIHRLTMGPTTDPDE